ncbi:hypothetical protein [Lacinutrix sp.]|uniref:hypothetical protein n=1 Tax=Lacinutrix sp. TaxID=1937692 RepID=UPI0025BC8251|nr:hypothetical protein [Lacinutrix sp.]
MQSQEQIRLNYCNKCINKKEDSRFGTLCGLTDQKPNFKYTCKDFIKGNPIANFQGNSKPKRQEQPTYKQPRKQETTTSKSPFWIGGSILFTVIVIGLKIARSVSRFDNNSSNNQTEYNNDYLRDLQKAQQNRNKVSAINYLSPKNRQATFNRKMKTDTVIVINPRVNLMLPKGFRLSISETDSELPIKATSRGYYFICNKLTKNKNQKQLEQWEAYRTQLIKQYPNSELVVRKPLTVNTTTNDIDRIDFEIKNVAQTIIGTARIVDYKNERYFFQLVSDASNADHTITNRYLRYYVKVK